MADCYCPNPIVTGYTKDGKPKVNHQDLSLHNPTLYAELYNPREYKLRMKDWCVYCGARTPGTWHFYWGHGNCCAACSVRQSLKSIKKSQ